MPAFGKVLPCRSWRRGASPPGPSMPFWLRIPRPGDRVIAHLKEKNIPNMIYYPTPQHALPVFKAEPHYGETYANANDYCARTLSLPMHPYMDDAQQQTIIDAVREAL